MLKIARGNYSFYRCEFVHIEIPRSECIKLKNYTKLYENGNLSITVIKRITVEKTYNKLGNIRRRQLRAYVIANYQRNIISRGNFENSH